jgi:hypothetical protein
MTPAIFAFLVMPGIVLSIGAVGYVIVILTDPARKKTEPAVARAPFAPRGERS